MTTVARLLGWLIAVDDWLKDVTEHFKLENEVRLLNGLSDQALADIGVNRASIRESVHRSCPLCKKG